MGNDYDENKMVYVRKEEAMKTVKCGRNKLGNKGTKGKTGKK
jgi:hypothetical protein